MNIITVRREVAPHRYDLVLVEKRGTKYVGSKSIRFIPNGLNLDKQWAAIKKALGVK